MIIVSLAMLLMAPVTPSSAEAVVQAFYAQIIKHHPLGVPEGNVRDTLWPFLSARVQRQLEAGQACEQDYYRQHSRVPNADQPKPEFAWLEQGLFSGWNEMALPAAARIRRTDVGTAGRYRVDLGFTYRDTFATYGRPPDDSNTFRWSGAVHVISEGDRYVLDEFNLRDPEGKPLPAALGFPGCKGSRWIGFRAGSAEGAVQQ